MGELDWTPRWVGTKMEILNSWWQLCVDNNKRHPVEGQSLESRYACSLWKPQRRACGGKTHHRCWRIKWYKCELIANFTLCALPSENKKISQKCLKVELAFGCLTRLQQEPEDKSVRTRTAEQTARRDATRGPGDLASGLAQWQWGAHLSELSAKWPTGTFLLSTGNL